jgi:hypothetical protein
MTKKETIRQSIDQWLLNCNRTWKEVIDDLKNKEDFNRSFLKDILTKLLAEGIIYLIYFHEEDDILKYLMADFTIDIIGKKCAVIFNFNVNFPTDIEDCIDYIICLEQDAISIKNVLEEKMNVIKS